MGRRGPQPQPDNVRALNGYAGHSPKRNDLKPEPIQPEQPLDLTQKAKEIWAYLAPELGKNALLTKRDKFTFQMLCENAALYFYAAQALQTPNGNYEIVVVDDSHQGRISRHPAIFVMDSAFKNYMKAAEHFGLSPTSRVGILGTATGNPTTPPGVRNDDIEELWA